MPLRSRLMVGQVAQPIYLSAAMAWPNWLTALPGPEASSTGQGEKAENGPTDAPSADRLSLFLPTVHRGVEPLAGPNEGQPVPAGIEAGPVVRLSIPAIGVDRAVVPVDMRPSANGLLDWNTDALFATRNRLDLVGQPIISTNPGQGGNVILIGHNYDQGVFVWEGVFVKIRDLQPGSEIQVTTQSGLVFRYQVKLVKKVPWANGSPDELAKHFKFLGPQPSETLTLVTCGGANVWPWPARIYVQAYPMP